MRAFALLLLALLAGQSVAVHAGICCDEHNCGTGTHCTDYGCDVWGDCSCRCVLNTGTIVGMVVALVGLTVICAVACRRRHRQRRALFLATQAQAQVIDGQSTMVYSSFAAAPQTAYAAVPVQATYAYPPQQQAQQAQAYPQAYPQVYQPPQPQQQQAYQQQPAYVPQGYQPQQ